MNTRGQCEVAAVTPQSLALLDLQLGKSGMPDMHQRRFKVQVDGRGLYLAAWQSGVPVGHVLLHFKHPPHHASYARYPDCAYVEALDVSPENRRQGIALALMREAEQQATAAGAALVGLSVGVQNAPARALYRALGYQPTDFADYPVSWTYLDQQTGEMKEEGEACSFWAKSLAM